MAKTNSKTQLKPVRILLTGASYSEHKGSAAILMSTMQCITESFPHARFLFCSFTPDVDQQKLRLPNVYVIPYSFKIRSFEFLLGALWIGITKNRPINIPLIKCIGDSDIVLDLSGDTFSSEYGTTSILSIGARIVSAKFLRKPTVLYCQSIGPFKGTVDRCLAKFFLKLADITIAREYITANYLHTLGVNSYVCADPAFLLEPTYSSVLKLPNNNKPIIGVNLSQYIDVLYGGDHTANKYRLIMSQFIDRLIEQYNAHVLIIPEVKKQETGAYDDYYVSKKIVTILKHQENVAIIDGDHSPSELKAIVGECDLIISPRFHMVIFALSQYIPSIAIAYIPKSYGIMEMVGQSEYVINHQELDIDLLMTKVQKLWVNKDEVKQCLEIKMNEIRTRSRNASKLVQHLIEETKE